METFSLGVLRSCREAHAVAMRSLYTNNVFILDGPFINVVWALQQIPESYLKLIKDICLSESVVACNSTTSLDQDPAARLQYDYCFDLITKKMTLRSLTIPIYRDIGFSYDIWYKELGKAVWQKRLRELRLHHLHGTPKEENRKGLGNLYHCEQMLYAYYSEFHDPTILLLRTSFLRMGDSDNGPPLHRLLPIKQRLDDIIWQQRSLCPFETRFVTPEPGESGLVVAVRHDSAGARARLDELEEKLLQRHHDFDDDDRAVYPLLLVPPAVRFAAARSSIDDYDNTVFDKFDTFSAENHVSSHPLEAALYQTFSLSVDDIDA